MPQVNDALAALLVPLARLREDPQNVRVHDARNVQAIAASLARFGQQKPIVVLRDGRVIAGNGTLRVALALGWTEIAAVEFDSEEEARARAYAIADNRASELASWEVPALADALDALRLDGWADALGFGDEEVQALRLSVDGPGAIPVEEARGRLAERFLVPPFSVLDSRQGYWKQRKAAWLALGIESEVGRGENLLRFSKTVLGTKGERPALSGARGRKERYDARKANRGLWQGGVQGKDPTFYAQKRKWEAAQGRRISTEEFREKFWVPRHYKGTSVFDPVLCELAYRWFCPAGGRVFDPFAGGSVRGIVAALLGRPYLGLDLRPEQVEANEAQARRILAEPGSPPPRWLVADSTRASEVIPPGEEFDLVFTCPPYFDLERYSEDPADLSNLSWEGFAQALTRIVGFSLSRLRSNRFAVFVVGEVRGEQGAYRGLVPLTIDACVRAGAAFYNSAILVTFVASLAMRVGRQFEGSRKLGTAHQHVLVFYKGDPRKLFALAAEDAKAAADALALLPAEEEGQAEAPENGEEEEESPPAPRKKKATGRKRGARR